MNTTIVHLFSLILGYTNVGLFLAYSKDNMQLATMQQLKTSMSNVCFFDIADQANSQILNGATNLHKSAIIDLEGTCGETSILVKETMDKYQLSSVIFFLENKTCRVKENRSMDIDTEFMCLCRPDPSSGYGDKFILNFNYTSKILELDDNALDYCSKTPGFKIFSDVDLSGLRTWSMKHFDNSCKVTCRGQNFSSLREDSIMSNQLLRKCTSCVQCEPCNRATNWCSPGCSPLKSPQTEDENSPMDLMFSIFYRQLYNSILYVILTLLLVIYIFRSARQCDRMHTSITLIGYNVLYLNFLLRVPLHNYSMRLHCLIITLLHHIILVAMILDTADRVAVDEWNLSKAEFLLIAVNYALAFALGSWQVIEMQDNLACVGRDKFYYSLIAQSSIAAIYPIYSYYRELETSTSIQVKILNVIVCIGLYSALVRRGDEAHNINGVVFCCAAVTIIYKIFLKPSQKLPQVIEDD